MAVVMAQNLVDVLLQIEAIAFEYPETAKIDAVLCQAAACCFYKFHYLIEKMHALLYADDLVL